METYLYSFIDATLCDVATLCDAKNESIATSHSVAFKKDVILELLSYLT